MFNKIMEIEINIVLISENKLDNSFPMQLFCINGFATLHRLNGPEKEETLSSI